MRLSKVTGIIIKRKNFGESDRIITVFTKQQGKITIKAKGVRKITSRRSSHVELINYGVMNLYKGQGMPILTEIETKQSFHKIKTNLQKTGYAYHICELIDGLCPENQVLPAVFNLFLETLCILDNHAAHKSILSEFEISLLTVLGYWADKQHSTNIQTEHLIESILERKLKTIQILPHMQ